MLVSAHFTVHELPGTVAILLIGMILGLALADRRSRVGPVGALLIGLILIGLVVSVLSDHDRSVSRLVDRTVGDLGLQIVWLIAIVASLAREGRARRRVRGG